MMTSVESILHNRALKADGKFHHLVSPCAIDTRTTSLECNIRRFQKKIIIIILLFILCVENRNLRK